MAKILVAEHNKTIADYLTRMLKKSGHALHMAENCLDTWRATNRESFDILLIDISMPGIDSFVLAQKALQENPYLQIIFVTGFAAVCMETISMPAYAPVPVTSASFHLSDINARIRYLMGHGGLPVRPQTETTAPNAVIYADFSTRGAQQHQA